MRQLSTMIDQDSSKTDLLLLATTILKIMNEASERKKFIHDILLAIKQATGFAAIGIKLKESDDDPYYDSEGFQDCFIDAEGYAERSSCTNGSSGSLRRFTPGKVCLECMCVNVLAGRMDFMSPFFTNGGSFWSNNTTELLDSTEADLQVKNCSRCHDEGYESVALIPLRFKDRIIGLLQLSDRRIGSFTLETIEFFEVLGNSIGIALDRKRMEEQAMESEKINQAILDNTCAAIAVVEDNGTITLANSEFEKLTGFNREEIEGKRLWTGFIEDELEKTQLLHNLTVFKHAQANSNYEFRIKDRFGQVKDVLLHAESIPGTKERTTTFTDITKQKSSEEALATAEERYRTLVETLNDVIFTLDIHGVIVYISPVVEQILGYAVSEVVGQPFSRFIYPEDLPGLFASFEHTIEGKFEPFEFRVLNKANQIRYVRTSSRLLLKDNLKMGLTGILEDITGRRQAEEALKKSEERLNLTLDAVNDGIWDWDLQTGDAVFSPRYFTMLGYEPYEFPQNYESWKCLVHPEDIDVAVQNIKESIDNGRGYAIEIRMRTRSGDWRWILSRGRMVERDLEGHPVRMVGTHSDITERKRVEEELQNSRSLLLAITEGTIDAIYAKDIQGRYLTANLGVARFVGKSQAEIIGQDDRALFSEADADQIMAGDRRVMDKGKTLTYEEYLTLADGLHTFLAIKGPMRDASGEVIGLFGIARDISERKKAEDDLRVEKEKAERYLNIAEVILIALDARARITLINRKGYQILGYKKDELIGKDWFEICLRPQDRESLYEVNRRIIRGEIEAFEYCESYILNKMGEERLIAWHTTTIKDDTGQIIGTLSSGEDVTDRKRYEEMLLKAKDAAEEATRAKSEFLANMSHEIRTPMNAVIGATCLLQGESLTPEQKEYAETIRSSGEALLSIINDILDLSKSDGGMMELERQPFNLQRRIEATLDFVAVRASEKGLKLDYAIEDDVPSVILGDPTRFGQILTNLLNNAVKFTERGTVEISVSGRKQEDERYEIHFAVKDTGIGIPENKIERLFQPFSQVDASTTRKYGGTGLGLAISRRLVNLMGGKIWAKSIVGVGSTFHFTISAESSFEVPLDNFECASEKDLNHAEIDHTLRILLAEDNLVNQKVAQKMLSKLGYGATVAANGIEVLQALENQHFDVILMDVQMPEIDGLEATRSIRKRWRDGPKIIAMTASALKGDREMCLAAGMDDYISKPVSMEELARTLCRYRSSVNNS